MTLPGLPAFTLPRAVADIVSRLPARPPAMLIAAALDLGVGRIVSRDAIDALAGRRFALVVRDAGLSVRFDATDAGFRAATDPREPDLTVTATLRDFIALALREEDPDTLFFAGRLAVEGDTDLGLTVKNLLDGIDWASALRRFIPLADRAFPAR